VTPEASGQLHPRCADARSHGTREAAIGNSCLPLSLETELRRGAEGGIVEPSAAVGGHGFVEVRSAECCAASEAAKFAFGHVKESDGDPRLSNRTALDPTKATLNCRLIEDHLQRSLVDYPLLVHNLGVMYEWATTRPQAMIPVIALDSCVMFVLKKPVSLAIALIGLWGSIRTAQASTRHVFPTTLCEVLSHSAGWDNKLISVSASYFDGGWPGGPVIADDRCEAGVVEVIFAKQIDAERYLDSSIPRDSLGTFDHSVQATWTGRFHANYGKFHETFLDVREITNLSVASINFSKSDASPIPTSIEEVVTHPRVFNHQTIAFHSRFEKGMHGSMVFECGSENEVRGISIRSTAGANGGEALEDALRQGGPGTLDKTIEADWIGRLGWFPNPPPFHPVYRIQITAIRNLTVSRHAKHIPLCGSESDTRPVLGTPPPLK
jgi:hypothetical protein